MKISLHRTATLISLLLLLGFGSLTAAGSGKDLIAAATRGDRGAVQRLLDKGADVNAKDGKGQTALYFAALSGHKEVAELLIVNKADINAGANDGVTPLQIAVAAGHREVAELLIAKGADVNAKARSGFTALSFAASLGRKELAELLIAKGADVDAKDGNITPLYLAAASGHRDVAELLIAKGADVNAKDSTGLTLLQAAASNGERDVAELLIANKADVNAVTNDGVTPLQTAVAAGHREVAELLIAKGADVNAKARSGFTALSFAASLGRKELAELLIANKADVNAATNDGVTPLQIAVAAGHREVAELLIAKGADVNAKARSGLAALGLAEANSHTDVAELLGPAKALPTSPGLPEPQGLVYVYRRQHLPPPALYISIFVNRVALGNLNNNSYVQLAVPTGKAAVIATHADDRDSLKAAARAFPECADLLSERCLAALEKARDATVAPRVGGGITEPELVFRICHIRTYGKSMDGRTLYDLGDLQTCNIFWGHAFATLVRSTLAKPLEIEIEAGKSYYVKWSVHSFTGVKMEVVDAATGAKEVKDIPPAKDQ